MHPQISVIVPNFNHARYLDQRIQSVLGQTYQNFELIILDDCSTDNSLEVIEKYRTDSHVSQIVANKVNSGSTFIQWMKGIEMAKGDLIWIAESDDYCEPSFLEKQISVWSRDEKPAFSYASSINVDEEGNQIYSRQAGHQTIRYKGKDFIRKFLICSNYEVPNVSAVIFRKDLALSVSRDFMDYKAAGDRLFWIYMSELGDVCKIDAHLNYFRQHHGKVSPAKEADGTTCRENHRINQYLHSKNYITGLLRLKEYHYYWCYIVNAHFLTEDIRRELLILWFPCPVLRKPFCAINAGRMLKLFGRL